MRRFAPEDRGVSTTVGYALSLGISAILISGLLIAGGGFLQDQRVTSTRSELTVIGDQIAADIASADRLVGSSVSNVMVQRNLPDRVTGSAYTVQVVTSPQAHLVLNSSEPDVTVRVDVDAHFSENLGNGLRETSVDGGGIEIVYDPDGNDELVVRNV